MDLDIRIKEYAEVLRRPFSEARAEREYFSTIAAVDLGIDGTAVDWVENKEDLQQMPKLLGFKKFFAASLVDLQDVVGDISKSNTRALSVMAPPGVGKTTMMPHLLRQNYSRRDVRVIVLEPTKELAAAQVHNLLSGNGQAHYCGPGSGISNADVGKDSVAFTTPHDMLLRLRRGGFRDASLVIVHDECHENDYATYVLRNVWAAYPCIKKYIITSATLPAQGSDASQRHVDAQNLVVREFPECDELDATALDVLPGGQLAPWHIKNLYGKKTLVFVERDRLAYHMTNLYGNFMESVSLRRSDGHEKYIQVVSMLSHVGRAGIVIFADSAYQTGYTLNVDQVIDFGYRRQTVDAGGLQPCDAIRKVTMDERRQRVERVGRYKSGVAYVSSATNIKSSSVLAPGEKGHAAALFVYMGFVLPADLSMYSVDNFLEADLLGFFKGKLPWELWYREFFNKKPGFGVARHSKTGDSGGGDLLENFFSWANDIRVSVNKVALKSGEFYSTSTGEVSADKLIVDSVISTHGDLYAWLRETLYGNPYKPLTDYGPVGILRIWTIWLTAWNTNVAKLVAIDRWKDQISGSAKGEANSLFVIPENYGYLELLMKMACDIRTKWNLLSDWYEHIFNVHPMELRICPMVESMVAAQVRVVAYLVPDVLLKPVASGEIKLAESQAIENAVDNEAAVTFSRLSLYDKRMAGKKKKLVADRKDTRLSEDPMTCVKSGTSEHSSSSSGKSFRAKTYVFPKTTGTSGYWR